MGDRAVGEGARREEVGLCFIYRKSVWERMNVNKDELVIIAAFLVASTTTVSGFGGPAGILGAWAIAAIAGGWYGIQKARVWNENQEF